LLGLAGRNELNVGIIMADLDNFKSINDTYGHPVGDKALKAAASIIEASLRKSDIPGRYGGEEFIVFASSEDADSLGAICERIRENIDKKSKDLCGIHFTVSLGAAYSKIEGSEKETLTKLIKIADDKLLEAKKAGKNCWIV
jgi:diguanylate cyclase